MVPTTTLFFFQTYTGEGPPLVIVAVKVTGVPVHIELPGFAEMLIVGTDRGLTVITIGTLVAVVGLTQGALLVTVHLIASPVTSALSVYVLLLDPTGKLFLYHWYVGEGPPLVIVAVNVTGVPIHIVLPGLAVTTIVGETFGLMVIVMALLVAVVGTAQSALLVITTVTTSLLLSVALE